MISFFITGLATFFVFGTEGLFTKHWWPWTWFFRSTGQIYIWADNDLKYIHPKKSHQIQILSRVQEHIMDLKKNTKGATGPQLIKASAPTLTNATKGSQPAYKKVHHSSRLSYGLRCHRIFALCNAATFLI